MAVDVDTVNAAREHKDPWESHAEKEHVKEVFNSIEKEAVRLFYDLDQGEWVPGSKVLARDRFVRSQPT